MNDKNTGIEELLSNSHKDNFGSILDDLVLSVEHSDNDEVFHVNLDTSLDDMINQLEKVLKLEVLSDDEWADLNNVEEKLQEDIFALDFE